MNITKLMHTAAETMRPEAPHTAAIIVAAGSAARMGGIDKVMADLAGMPLIAHSLLAFQQSELIHEIVVVTRPDLVDPVRHLCRLREISKLICVVPGGASRTESVCRGLAQVSQQAKLVAIHDAARPLIDQQTIARALRKAAKTGAAAPALPVKDTIKVVKRDAVVTTPERSKLMAVQTPQCFDKELLQGAFQKAQADQITLTDDCSAMEHLGLPVYLTQGAERNFKVTTPLDLELARLLADGAGEG